MHSSQSKAAGGDGDGDGDDMTDADTPAVSGAGPVVRGNGTAGAAQPRVSKSPGNKAKKPAAAQKVTGGVAKRGRGPAKSKNKNKK